MIVHSVNLAGAGWRVVAEMPSIMFESILATTFNTVFCLLPMVLKALQAHPHALQRGLCPLCVLLIFVRIAVILNSRDYGFA